MSNINNTKVAEYMFEQLQEAVENDDVVSALEVEKHLAEFGFKDEAVKALEIIKLNFKNE